MNNISFPSIPRIESLYHRLKSAKGPEGEGLGLLDELMVFLEDPPPEVRDRWRAGADWCAEQGIATSRAAVWRFYREHVVQWRFENTSAADEGEGSLELDAKLARQARHLLSLRAVESLRHPFLPPRVLACLEQNENRRQELKLARDKFDEQLLLRRREDDRLRQKAIEKANYNAAFEAFWPKIKQAYSGVPSQWPPQKTKPKPARVSSAATEPKPCPPSPAVSPHLT